MNIYNNQSYFSAVIGFASDLANATNDGNLDANERAALVASWNNVPDSWKEQVKAELPQSGGLRFDTFNHWGQYVPAQSVWIREDMEPAIQSWLSEIEGGGELYRAMRTLQQSFGLFDTAGGIGGVDGQVGLIDAAELRHHSSWEVRQAADFFLRYPNEFVRIAGRDGDPSLISRSDMQQAGFPVD
jgi:hypothetical protein